MVNPYHEPASIIGRQLRQSIHASGFAIYSMNQSAGKPVVIAAIIHARSEVARVEYIMTSSPVL
jgi:hypothetical protein